jgi:hypothetical protein
MEQRMKEKHSIDFKIKKIIDLYIARKILVNFIYPFSFIFHSVDIDFQKKFMIFWLPTAPLKKSIFDYNLHFIPFLLTFSVLCSTLFQQFILLRAWLTIPNSMPCECRNHFYRLRNHICS